MYAMRACMGAFVKHNAMYVRGYVYEKEISEVENRNQMTEQWLRKGTIAAELDVDYMLRDGLSIEILSPNNLSSEWWSGFGLNFGKLRPLPPCIDPLSSAASSPHISFEMGGRQ